MRPRDHLVRGLLAALLGLAFAGVAVGACSGWDPRSPFERNAPEVDEALADLDAGRLESAEATLEKYLGTGVCGDAGIGLPDTVRQKPNGSFDLGLVLFHLAERYGKRFGDEEQEGQDAEDPQAGQRSLEIDCALVIVKAIAADPSVPIELRARAYYLAGNLEFLRKKYEDAVRLYDEALKLVPGIHEEAGGDGIGRDAAWNRAIALRRIQDKDGGQDGADGEDGASDAPPDSPPDAPDGADGSEGDDGGDAGAQQDGGKDGGSGDAGKDAEADPTDKNKDKDDQGDGGAQPPEPKQEPQPQPATPDQKEDDRILDRLEEAPTYQEQEAKSRANVRRGRVMEDK